MTVMDMCKLSKEELYQIMDLGLLNLPVAGYMIDAMRNAGIEENMIGEAVRTLYRSFDMLRAGDAEAVYHEFVKGL